MKQIILQKTSEIKSEVIAIRRHLHQHPELSFQEFETSKYIQAKLTEWEIPFEKNIAGTGVVALIKGGISSDKCVGLRADMDALPIHELNNVSYKSVNNGIMHACGHDVHTSILLGTAKILNELKEHLTTSVKLIFQPGEEKLPGGAKLMIEQGVLENPKVEKIYALHVFPELEAGKVGLKSGMYMASCDELYFTIIGKGGHAAMPAQNIDPILVASKFILALQEIPSQNKNQAIPTVVAIGKIEGLGATNVIPNKVELQGTFRTMNETWRNEAHLLIHDLAKKIGTESGAEIKVNIQKGYPYLENDNVTTEQARKELKEFFGDKNVIELPIRMTGEDFSFYAQKIPASFIRLGVRNEEKGIIMPVHNPAFNIDENALEIGIQTFLRLVLK